MCVPVSLCVLLLEMILRFTTSSLYVTSSTQWYPTNGSNLQWKIKVGFIKSGGEC